MPASNSLSSLVSNAKNRPTRRVRPTFTARPRSPLGWWLTLSLLAHIVGFSGSLRYLTKLAPFPPPEPFQVTLAPPVLPDGPLPVATAVSHLVPQQMPQPLLPQEMHSPASLPSPAAFTPSSPQAAVLPPPRVLEQTRQPAADTETIPVRVPEVTLPIEASAPPDAGRSLIPAPPEVSQVFLPALPSAAIPVQGALIVPTPVPPSHPTPTATLPPHPALTAPVEALPTASLAFPSLRPTPPASPPPVPLPTVTTTAHLPSTPSQLAIGSALPISPAPSAPAYHGQQEVVALPQTSRSKTAPALPPQPQAGPTALPGVPGAPRFEARGQIPSVLRQTAVESMPRFVYQPKPDYPFLAQRQGWEGTVVLEIELLADGTIGEVNIVTSSGHLLLDDVALKTVQTWRHAPVQRNGTPVTRRAYLPIRFQLD